MSDQTNSTTAPAFQGSVVIESLLNAFYSGDIPTVESLLAPSITVHQSAGLPYSGDFHGVEGFMTMASLLGRAFELENLSRKVLDSGNESVLFLDLKFISRDTGKVGFTSNVEWYTFEDGKILDINVYYKDAALISGLTQA